MDSGRPSELSDVQDGLRIRCRKCRESIFVGVRCPHCGKVLARKINFGDSEYCCPRCKCDIRLIVRSPELPIGIRGPKVTRVNNGKGNGRVNISTG